MPDRAARSHPVLLAATIAGALLFGGSWVAHATAAEAATTAPGVAKAAVQHRPSKPVAYWFCRATIYRWAAENPDVDPFTVHSYRHTSITPHGEGWRVVVVGKPHAHYGAHTPADYCDVTGTDARPVLAGGLMPR